MDEEEKGRKNLEMAILKIRLSTLVRVEDRECERALIEDTSILVPQCPRSWSRDE